MESVLLEELITLLQMFLEFVIVNFKFRNCSTYLNELQKADKINGDSRGLESPSVCSLSLLMPKTVFDIFHFIQPTLKPIKSLENQSVPITM